MSISPTWIFWIIFGYGMGSLPFGLWVPIWMRKGDPRTTGSGNTGATNVFRLAGWKCSAWVYALDMGKGMMAILFAPDHWRWQVALAALMGHMFSVWLKGRGGKGVATMSGIIFFMTPWMGLILLLNFLIIFLKTRYVSLASLISMGLFWGGYGAMIFLKSPLLFSLYTSTKTENLLRNFFLISVMFFLIVFRHKDNIFRLFQKKEMKIS